ncbi:polysaccharide lyase family 7 protein [Erythrobacter sp. F6033]|uniref:polysaccharide lyase family 7 protein n=1 Tax=Erythrobacter sp. F6033 TaxID=2926401 RepID=UPI001FF37E23|nr:polysaccharide lyase family 7 protein [Erythrobacter sp. F6033]MCK0127147.1 polysaccharide lyase family 7 protein [Erythrobacter sp. F6033]
MSQWKITLPMDANKDGKVDEKTVAELKTYHHPDFFYLNENGRLVFAAPNKATTTANSSNTRSELRQMIRGTNTRIGTHDPRNNFAVEARKGSDKFGAVGGKLNATLRVDHVALNAGEPEAKAAYSVVVGQIHATKLKSTSSGFGYGNEPIKIYFKKQPGHQSGVVFWNYERNLAKDDPDRNDLSVPVFGGNWETKEDPGENGIKLGEEFSYEINVHRNTMYLTFHNERLGTVVQSRSLVRGADDKDNPYAYGGDALYFKAGVYNQCSTKSGGGNWYAACAGTGDWEVDKANGDYAQATFSRIELSESTPPPEG